MGGWSCLNGSEMKPGSPEYLQLTGSIIADIFGAAWWATPLQAVYQRVVKGIEAICAGPHPGYPPLTAEVFASQLSLAAWADQWLWAHLWDTYCQCKAPEGGCGSTFTGLENGIEYLNALNATHHYAGGVETNPATVIETGTHYGYAGCTASLNATPNDGDLLLFFVGQADPYEIIPPSGLTLVQGAYASDAAGYLWRKVWRTGDPVSYAFTGHANSYPAVDWFVIRGADQSDPIAASDIANGNGSHRTLPAITLAADHELTIGWAVNWGTEGTWTLAPGYGNGVAYHPFDTSHAHQRSTTLDAGSTGALDVDSGNTAHWRAIHVAVRGAPSDPTDYLSWESAEAADWGYAVQTAEGTLAENNQHGAAEDGYLIEYHWPIAEGGDLEGDGAEWQIKTKAGTLIVGWEIDYFQPAEAAVWPCNYSETPDDPPETPEGVDDPYTATPCDLCELVEQFDLLTRKVDSLYNLLNFTAGVASASQGPFTGQFGPGGETATGTFQETVLAALRSIGSSKITGWTETLLESDVEGDTSFIVGYPAYRISFTTIPAWAGKRIGTPPLYEVNSRRDQLGWAAFTIGGGLAEYRITVWQNMVLYSPAGASQGLQLHVAEGCICDVYGLEPVYSSQ